MPDAQTGEFDLIARIRARALSRDDVVLGIGDDAAVLQPPEGQHLVVAMDTLNAGVHFPDRTAADAIGWKALAVNLSDLAAMGATPAWCTLSLSLPHGDAGWIDRFLDGFGALARRQRVALVGGDTTRGPLSVSVTAHGFVAPGRMLRRAGARVGDDIWVTGTLGDAAAALAQWRSGEKIDDGLRIRLERPSPRIATGQALSGIAHACIDVSDGLLADLGHLCGASGVGAEIALDVLPASPALVAVFEDQDARRRLQASGGDDYELCFTAPMTARSAIVETAASTQVAATRIGMVVDGHEVAAFDRDGRRWMPEAAGFTHF